MDARGREARMPKKRPSSAKLSRDLRGGSDGMSRAVADNFILSAADLPDPPLPSHRGRHEEPTCFPPSTRRLRRFARLPGLVASANFSASPWSYKRISASTVHRVARYRPHIGCARDDINGKSFLVSSDAFVKKTFIKSLFSGGLVVLHYCTDVHLTSS